MPKRKIRNLAVTCITIASAIALAVLGTTGASAATTPAASPAQAFGGVQVVNHDGLCLGISGGDDDAPAVQWHCLDAANQYWHWVPSSVDLYRTLVNGDGQCLGVAGGDIKYGARVVGWNCTGHLDQLWVSYFIGCGCTNLPENFENYEAMPNGQTAVIGIEGGSTTNGAPVVLWGWEDAPNQLWY